MVRIAEYKYICINVVCLYALFIAHCDVYEYHNLDQFSRYNSYLH